MAVINNYAPGSFCWAELATSDPEAAKKFYSEMFGWQIHDSPMPSGTYTIFEIDGNSTAAAYDAPAGVPTHWGLYFSVENVDDSAAKVTSLGGTLIMPPFDVMTAGRMAVVQDPQGATFQLWQAKDNIGATHAGPLSMPTWPELHTSDAAAAAKFYGELLGWKFKPDTGLESVPYAEWSVGSEPSGGLMPMTGPEWTGVPPHWMMYITVADCDERAAKAKELGAQVCVPPTDIPNTGRFSVINDAQGATFSLFQRSAAHS